MNNEEIKNTTGDTVDGSMIEQTPITPIQTVDVMPRKAPQVIATAISAPEIAPNTPPSEQKEEYSIPAIHTIEGDLFAAMKDNSYGDNIVKIVTNPTANTNARFRKLGGDIETEADKKDAMKKYIKYIVVGSIVFIGAGVAAILYMNEKHEITRTEGTATTTATSTPIIKITSIINPEVYKKLNVIHVDKNGFIKQITEVKTLLRNSNIAANTNIGLTLDIDIKSLFLKLRYAGPDSLLRSLADDYVFGLFSDKERTFEPYILLRINSYDLAFAGILEWEPYMPGDLKGIFAREQLLATSTVATTTTNTATTTIASSTQSQQRTAPTVAIVRSAVDKKFTDQVIKNIDARVYVDEDIHMTLVYGFINKEYLLITGGVDSFIDIRNKILTKNILR